MKNISRTTCFKGLNRCPYQKDGEIREMTNISGNSFPYLSPRGKKEDYLFNVSVPATKGDGYVDDVTVLPTATKENQGFIYNYIPEANIYKTGKFYKYNDGWNTDESFSKENIVDVLPFENTEDDTLYSAMQNVGTKIRYIGDTTQSLTKGKFYEYRETLKQYFWKKLAKRPDYYAKYDKDVFTYEPCENRQGTYMRWYGPSQTTTYTVRDENNNLLTQVENGCYYVCLKHYKRQWVQIADIYTPCTTMPQNPQSGDLVRFMGTNNPETNSYYKVQRDCIDNIIAYFYENTTPDNSAVCVSTMQTACAQIYGNIYKYTGTNLTNSGYRECVRDNNGYIWHECDRPFVNKSLTIKDYIDNYYTSIKLKKVLDIHEHCGVMSCLISDCEGNVHLMYENKCYKVPTMSDKGLVKLVSCGEKLYLGESGAVFDALSKEFSCTGGTCSFNIECKSFSNPVTNVSYCSKVEYGKIYIYTQNENLAVNMKTALNFEGKEIEVLTKNTNALYTVTSANYKNASFGYQNGSSWVDVPLWKVTILINNNSDSRLFQDSLTIRTKGQSDVVAWKNRLWTYDGSSIKGSALEIFNASGAVVWSKSENTEMDSVYRKQWQGGSINAICAQGDYIMCFHPEYITILSGNTKSTLYTKQIKAAGIRKGNEKSLAVDGGNVFYLSDDGVYLFNSGFPRLISKNIKISGTEAVGGASHGKYYLSLKEKGGEDNLYVYDMENDVWHRE